MTEIQVLPSNVVDQISAGEVIERPAQLVKELIENAIDARASHVEIEFGDGGRFVQVQDDGSGIEPNQLKLAVTRFATSKIQTAEDLWRLESFGFRGEALASVAAVSRLEIRSRPQGAGSAHRLASEFGKLGDVEPVSGNKGTTVRAEELFANLPVRLKFLKSETSESAAIRTMVKAMALANEKVKFSLKSKNKLEFTYRPCSFLERSREVLETPELFLAQGESSAGEVEIAFSSPHVVQGNSRQIWLFVQGRYVQDRGLQAAVMEAYRNLLMHGEYPFCVVRLRVPAETVDVNIHPSKAQVKFQKPSDIFSLVHSTLRNALEKAPWQKKQAPSQPRPVSVDAVYRGEAFEPSQLRALRVDEPELKFQAELPLQNRPSESHGPGVESSVWRWSDFQVLGQFHATYIICQSGERLILVDQHAAHERVAFERLMLAFQEGDISESQPMLIPLTVELGPEALEALMSAQEQIRRFGIDIDQLGPQSVSVRSLPSWIKESAAVQALSEFAESLAVKGGSFAIEKKFADLAASLACHSVVRAGENLTVDEMQSLLKQMDDFPLSSFCPHGRPVSIEWSLTELEKKFGRIV